MFDNQTLYSFAVSRKIEKLQWQTLEINQIIQTISGQSAGGCSINLEYNYAKFWNLPIEMQTVSDITEMDKAIVFD